MKAIQRKEDNTTTIRYVEGAVPDGWEEVPDSPMAKVAAPSTRFVSTGEVSRRKNPNTIHLPGMREAVTLPQSRSGARDTISRLVDKHMPHLSGKFDIRGGRF